MTGAPPRGQLAMTLMLLLLGDDLHNVARDYDFGDIVYTSPAPGTSARTEKARGISPPDTSVSRRL